MNLHSRISCVHYLALIFFMSLLSCTGDDGIDYPAKFVYNKPEYSFEGIYKVTNNQASLITTNTGSFGDAKKLLDANMLLVVDNILKDFKISEITLLSDSTISATSIIQGQKFTERGSYSLKDGQLSFKGVNEDIVGSLNENFSELTICQLYSLRSGKTNGGAKFYLEYWDFCKSRDRDAIIKELTLRPNEVLDTFMFYFVDMKFKR